MYFACDRLEGWPQVPDLPSSFETHCARQLATAMLLRMTSEFVRTECLNDPTMIGGASLLRLDVGLAHDLGPLRDLGRDQLLEFSRRAPGRRDALLLERGDDVGQMHDAIELGAQPINDRLGRPRRGQDADPLNRPQIGKALLGG